MVAVTQDFGRPFGGRIGLERAIAGIGFDEWDPLRVAIDGRGRGQHEVLYGSRFSGCVVQVLGAVQVDVHVEIGNGDRIPDPGHRCQMGDRPNVLGCEQVKHSPAIANVGFHHAEVRILAQALLVRSFPGRVIIIVEVVQADYVLTAAAEAIGQMAPDEAGSTGDQDGHRVILSCCAGMMSSTTSWRLEFPCQRLTLSR